MFESASKARKTLSKDPNIKDEKIPQDVEFMDHMLNVCYRKAYNQIYPRFAETTLKTQAKAQTTTASSSKQDINRTSWDWNKDTLSNEWVYPLQSAWSNSVYYWRFYWWWHSYPAWNAAVGSSHWLSRGFHGQDEVIIWEGTFQQLTRIHGLTLVWAYSPMQFKIDYTTNDSNNDYKTLIDWKNSVEDGNSVWWARLFPYLQNRYRSFADRYNFVKPIFAKKIRISMRGPVNFYFGLYRVNFWTKTWYVLLKNSQPGQCKENCMSINTVAPKPGTMLKSSECIGTIGYSENREMYALWPEGKITHFSTGYCLATNNLGQVYLDDCGRAEGFRDGRVFFTFTPEGTIESRYAPGSCVFVSTDSETPNLLQGATAEATSSLDDGRHNANRAVEADEGTYWASHPGDRVATLTLHFKEWMSVDTFNIKWKFPAVDYEIYVLSLEHGWKHVIRVSGNRKVDNYLKLGKVNVKVIQIKLNKSASKYLGKPIYGISKLFGSDGGTVIRREECGNITQANKTFQIDEQFDYFIGNNPPYMRAMNRLTQTFLELRRISRLINIQFDASSKSQQKSEDLRTKIRSRSEVLGMILEKIKLYKANKLTMKNFPYIEILKRFGLSRGDEIKGFNTKSIGTTPETPALDCFQIKKLQPNKKSGFYWIKPKCTPKSLRVFCDLSVQGLGMSLYVWNGERLPNTIIDDVELVTFNHIRAQCATVGLYPIKITSKLVMERITQLVRILGWKLSKPLFIPLGYDYSCDNGSCLNFYKSFNDKESDIINSFFSQEADKTSSPHDSIGLGYNYEGKPSLFQLKTAKITALICSTNNYGVEVEDPTVVSLDCEDKLNGNPKLDSNLNNKMKVKCPTFCVDNPTPVYGTNNYSDLSSICKAAVHAGIIKDYEGGEFFIKTEMKSDKFEGTTANSITSLKSQILSVTTFSVEAVSEKCPKDFYAEILEGEDFGKPPSFIETSATTKLASSALNEIKNGSLSDMTTELTKWGGLGGLAKAVGNEVKEAGKEAVHDAKKRGEEAVDGAKKRGEEGFHKAKKRGEEGFHKAKEHGRHGLRKAKHAGRDALEKVEKAGNEAVDKVQEKGREAMQKAHKLRDEGLKYGKNALENAKEAIGYTKEDFQKKLKNHNPQSNPAIAAEKEEKAKSENCNMNSDIARQMIFSYRDMDRKDFVNYKKFDEYLKKQRSEFINSFSFSNFPSDFSNKALTGLFSKLMIYARHLSKFNKLVFFQALQRIRKTTDNVSKLKEIFEKLQQQDDVGKDELGANLWKKWRVYDNKTAKSGKGKWSYTSSDLLGRTQAIIQTDEVHHLTKYPTILILKDKAYYDMDYTLDIMTRHTKTAGVIFKFANQFNFYALEINAREGYKRFVVVSDGEYKVLNTVMDGGMTQNTWYKVYIKLRTNRITVKFGLSSSYKNYTEMPSIFELELTNISRGSAGIFTNGNNRFYVDNVNVRSVNCWKQWNTRPNMQLINSRANIYFEDFKKTLPDKYIQVDVASAQNGPAEWKYLKNYLTYETVIKQTSDIKDLTNNNEPSKFILKNIYAGDGHVEGSFTGLSSTGVVAFIFRFMNPDNYYVFEIQCGDKISSSDDNEFLFQVRKKINGNFYLIARKTRLDSGDGNLPFLGYLSRKIYNVRLTLKGADVSIYYTFQGFKNKKKIFSFTDSDITHGYVGLGTNGTKAVFTSFSVMPHVAQEITQNFPPDVTDAQIQSDLFLYDIFKLKPPTSSNSSSSSDSNQNNSSSPEAQALAESAGLDSPTSGPMKFQNNNNFKKEYLQCIVNQTPGSRAKYCGNEFKNQSHNIKRCNNDFCDSCCKKTVSWIHKNTIYNCKKQCNKLTKSTASVKKAALPIWESMCLNIATPENSIYEYCVEHFTSPNELSTCKIDACKMCCVTSDKLEKGKSSITMIDTCFRACQKKFSLKPKKH